MHWVVVLANVVFLLKSYEACFVDIVETIPTNVSVVANLKSIYSAWEDLVSSSNSKIDVSSFYYTLNENIVKYPTAINGSLIFNLLKAKALQNVNITFIQNLKNSVFPDNDTDYLQKMFPKNVKVYDFNVKSFTYGIHHVKQLFSSQLNKFYIGSANLDWRALTEIVEIGIYGRSCTELSNDLYKIYQIHLNISSSGKIPSSLIDFDSKYNKNNPMVFESDKGLMCVYVGSSPVIFNPPNRDHDFQSLLDIITSSNSKLYITAMAFSLGNSTYINWLALEEELIKAAKRNVDVRIMVKPTKDHRTIASYNYLKTFGILIKFLVIPKGSNPAPFSRLTHSKYIVNEKMAWISTSNLQPTYFTQTTGISLLFNSTDQICTGSYNIIQTLNSVFLKYWSY